MTVIISADVDRLETAGGVSGETLNAQRRDLDNWGWSVNNLYSGANYRDWRHEKSKPEFSKLLI